MEKNPIDHLIPILSISGSDSTGQSGIQADIKTIAALGGYAVTAVSCVAVQGKKQGTIFYDLPTEVVVQQVSSILSDVRPKAIKVGLVRDFETIIRLRKELLGCDKLVVAPGIYASDGSLMMSEESLDILYRFLIPHATLLMLRCKDAEKLLRVPIHTDDDMKSAAQRLHANGAEWVMLRGGQHTQGQLTALLYGGEDKAFFFTSYNTEGWQRHGVGGALSAAIATRLGWGDDVREAVRNAHDYIHSQVVYAQSREDRNLRPTDIYNQFVSLVAAHYRDAHDVSFYAFHLCISTRYLSAVTVKVVGKNPKQVISDYIMKEARTYLRNTRMTVQEIANRLGFSSQTQFCKFFKAQEGCAPSGYRG